MCDKSPSASETNNESPYSSLNPKQLDEAAKRALDYYLGPKPEAKKKPASNQLFTVVDGIDTECLLANLSETLASANATVSDLAFELEGSRRHIALGVQQLIELSELLANRVLDERVPVPEG
ncbi:hypothetical protein FHJ31_28040 [Pseudomonas sp. Fig-3]|uniref:DUF6124 family protein n=1 Tax=Pseudomonas TaxID=286 RepID=UPI0010D3CF67|nr:MULTISPECIES: DUF6124 family protein [unclassified Pseudomonas]MXR32069.1 hypothetical protein [Pseudomonas sp. PICF6]TNB77327.1 hypothetical protein FHJ31_28040 [Pseudomonas sp. Fig-3]WLG23977.1 DUF6124 family protein [Pseudomonas sp. FP1154]WNZ79243.1 DUF6124 family protein [Pseudomonas sp. P105]VII93739.1 hypothetical protein [Pseudomonas sp. FG-3G]